MNTQELTAHLKHLNEYPQELLQNSPEDLLELENALYDLAEHMEEVRLGMISYEDKP